MKKMFKQFIVLNEDVIENKIVLNVFNIFVYKSIAMILQHYLNTLCFKYISKRVWCKCRRAPACVTAKRAHVRRLKKYANSKHNDYFL